MSLQGLGFCLWLGAGLLGFPLSLVLLIRRLRQFRMVVSESEKEIRRRKLRNAAILFGLCLLILISLLVGLILVSSGEAGKPL